MILPFASLLALMAATSNVDASALYQNTPLPAGSKLIRVLDVQGRLTTDQENGPIQPTLRVIDLEQHADFSALSYVWGPQATASHLVDCGGVVIAITKNCYSALKDLHGRLGPFTIWIDAICINQNDITEKSYQIALMGSIYSHAATVFVWLGEGEAATDRAMAYLGIAGFLEYFTTNVNTEEAEFHNFRHCAALWVCYRANWSARCPPLPISKAGEYRNCRVFPSLTDEPNIQNMLLVAGLGLH